jgi:hypothetical protein
MKLKEWGFMRHKPRNTASRREVGQSKSATLSQPDETEQSERDSSATVEPMSVDFASVGTSVPEPVAVDAQPTEPQKKRGGWQVVADVAHAEPTFMGLLHQTPT